MFLTFLWSSALLWHRLMGRAVLSTNFTGPTYLRSYAHCAKSDVSTDSVPLGAKSASPRTLRGKITERNHPCWQIQSGTLATNIMILQNSMSNHWTEQIRFNAWWPSTTMIMLMLGSCRRYLHTCDCISIIFEIFSAALSYDLSFNMMRLRRVFNYEQSFVWRDTSFEDNE